MKKIILSGLIAFLGAISYTNAISQDYYSPFTITSRCLYEVDYNMSNNGSFSSYYNGVQKNKILYFKGGTYNDCRGKQYIVFGRKNGKLYGFTRNDAGGVNQGYFNYYCYGSEPCTTMNVSSDTMINVLNNQGVKGLYLSTTNQAVFPDDGFNQNHIACFITNSQTVTYLCFYSGYPSNYTFSESLNFNVSDRDDLSSRDGFFDYSPILNTTHVREYSCPTIQQLLNTYPSEYNTNLCYSNNTIYSGGTVKTVTPKSIFTLYPQLTDFTKDIGTYNIYCKNESTACQTMFENKEEQYTLIAKIPDTVQPMKLYEYCNLSLNYDPTQTTCTANTGTQIPITQTGININDIITEIGESDYTVIKPGIPPDSTGTGNGSGSVYDGLINGEDDTQRWNVVRNAKDIINTMKELYTKFTGIFRGRSGTQGIIPFYITGLMLLIVLFKLFKK